MKALNFKNENTQKNIMIFLFLIVPVILVCMFTVWPAVKLFQQSFTDWNGLDPKLHYVGFQMYKDVFNDTESLMAFKNTFAYFIIMILQTMLGLYLAIVLNSKLKGRNFFKSLIFLPYILNGVAVAYMFQYVYDYNNGPINVLLRTIGLGNYQIHFFCDNYFINFSLAFIGMWRFTGFGMVIFLAALQSIPGDLYEAASIDGANFLQTIRYIILPSIKTTVELNLFLGISGSLQAFFEAFVITKGGPAGLSNTFVTKIVDIAFTYQNFGKASAMSVILLIIVVILIGLQKIIFRGDDEIA